MCLTKIWPLVFWIAHIIYLIDFGVPKMVILVFLLGVIRGGVFPLKQPFLSFNSNFLYLLSDPSQCCSSATMFLSIYASRCVVV